MNTLTSLQSLLCGTALAGAAAVLPLHAVPTTSETTATQAKPVLEVTVDLPPDWRIGFHYDLIAEAMGNYVYSVFGRMGFAGEVSYTEGFEARSEDAYRLNLRVIRWEITRVGNIECVFTADLETPRGQKNLGVFSDTVLTSITGRDRIWLADSFGDAAEGAIRDLYRAVAKSELVPGLREAQA